MRVLPLFFVNVVVPFWDVARFRQVPAQGMPRVKQNHKCSWILYKSPAVTCRAHCSYTGSAPPRTDIARRCIAGGVFWYLLLRVQCVLLFRCSLYCSDDHDGLPVFRRAGCQLPYACSALRPVENRLYLLSDSFWITAAVCVWLRASESGTSCNAPSFRAMLQVRLDARLGARGAMLAVVSDQFL